MKHNESAIWFLVGLSSLGLAVGYFVGFSASPVIGVLLPLLFGLIGGGSGIYLSRADFDLEKSRQQIRLIGQTCTVFSVSIIISSATVLVIKSSSGPVSDNFKSYIENSSPHDALNFLALRRTLEILGASKSESDNILLTVSTPQAIEPDSDSKIITFLEDIGKLSAILLSKITTDDGEQNDATKDLRTSLEINKVILPHWSQHIRSGKMISKEMAEKMAKMIEDTKSLVRQYLFDTMGDTKSRAFLAQHPEFLKTLADMEIGLSAQPSFKETYLQTNIHGIDTDMLVQALIGGKYQQFPDKGSLFADNSYSSKDTRKSDWM